MSNWNDLGLALGIKLPDLVAGLAGGIVAAFVFKPSSPMAVVGSIVVGAFTANYLGDSALVTAASGYVGTSKGASAFIVGLCGMAICQGIAEVVAKWRPGTPKGGGS